MEFRQLRRGTVAAGAQFLFRGGEEPRLGGLMGEVAGLALPLGKGGMLV